MHEKCVYIEVSGHEAAGTEFLTWLCEQGEQDYWQWMEIEERRDVEAATVLRFIYDFGSLRVTGDVGRMDQDGDA